MTTLDMGVRGLIMDDQERHIFRLNSAAFTDPSIYQLEMDKIFHNSWLYLSHESQIAQPNDYMTLMMGQFPVVLARDVSGKIRCFLNRCRHKGALVCRSESGNSSRFRCIYHNWTYRTDGRLVGVPDKPGFPAAFDFDDLNLVEIPRLESYKGFVFGSLSPRVPTLGEHLGNTRPAFDVVAEKFPEGIEVVRGTHKYGYKGNWKLFVENTLDIYHAPFVHKSVYDVTGLKNRKRLDYLTKHDSTVCMGRGNLLSIYQYPRDDEAASTSVYQRHMAKYLSDDEGLKARMGEIGAKWVKKITGYHLYIFPNLVLFDGEPPAPQIRIITPTSVDQTELVSYPYVPVGCSDEFREVIIRLYERASGPAGMVTADDMEVLNSITKGMQAQTVPWIDESRGSEREEKDVEIKEFLDFEVAGTSIDDTLYRSLYRWWANVLSR